MTVTASSTTLGVSAARTHLSELLARVEHGDEITITRHGTPIAYLIPVRQKTAPAQRRVAIDAMHELSSAQCLEQIAELYEEPVAGTPQPFESERVGFRRRIAVADEEHGARRRPVRKQPVRSQTVGDAFDRRRVCAVAINQ